MHCGVNLGAIQTHGSHLERPHLGGHLQLVLGKHARRIAAHYYRQQGRRVVRFRAMTCVLASEMREGKSIDHLSHEASQMSVSQSFTEGGNK